VYQEYFRSGLKATTWQHPGGDKFQTQITTRRAVSNQCKVPELACRRKIPAGRAK